MAAWFNILGAMPMLRGGRSCSINWENRTGEKGAGCQAASGLGPGRKGSPCIPGIAPGDTVILADISGCGVIQHIWCTVTDATPAGRFVLRDLVLRMYWDGETTPSVECPLGDFFLNGFARGCEVNSLPVVVNPKRGMNCFFTDAVPDGRARNAGKPARGRGACLLLPDRLCAAGQHPR